MYSYSQHFITILLLLTAAINCQNILFLQTTPSKSHHIWNKQIFDRLFDNGYNLTILTYELEQSIPGKYFLHVDNFYAKILALFAVGDESENKMTPIQNIINMYDFYEKASQVLMKEEVVRQLLNYPLKFKFDLIVHDFTMGQFLLGFVQRFDNPPLVSISAFNAPSYTVQIADIPTRYTTMPNYASSFGPRMNFLERTKNLFYWMLDYYNRQLVFMTNEDRRIRELFGKQSTSVKQVEKMSDIILVNCDLTMDYHQIFPPNVIPVGGLHISRAERVPVNIAEFMNRPGQANVLLSLGTNVQSESLGQDTNQVILNAFADLPEYNFIWKHGDPNILGSIPPNVLIQKWIPQSAVLSDSKTKLLIGHGGLLSLQEATWYGVPVIGIPFFADQFQNVDKLVRGGVGLKLLLDELNEYSLKQAAKTILTDASYHQKMAARSKLFKSQPQPPLERAVFWIEKVIENKGLLYLKSPSHHMPFYQVFGLDLVLTAVVILAVLWQLCICALSKVNKQS